ncbi:MAG TPA: SDR family NAD(P)-dependent oxidoreductase [Candidatus Binatia bacterium]|nr:SDR family NAD(P)-dependent oxidoreductase [Candidatus Binatia bacterium]
MKEFRNKVAVVTGAASGMGKAMAERFAAEGMKVVLADVEHEALVAAEHEFRTRGDTVLAVLTDVSRAADVDRLAARTIEAFGTVHVLCNNAGVGTGGLAWIQRIADWEWTLGVNLWGVIHGIRTFLPIMLAHGEEGHIVSTASIAGLISGPFQIPYNVSKYGVVAICEGLHRELALVESKIKVSVLCPGFVHTRITQSERNRPAELPLLPVGEVEMQYAEWMRARVAAGLAPTEVARQVFEAIRDERFYIVTDPDEWKPLVRERMEDILGDRNPRLMDIARA